ncbi:type II toxin-antitoxin system RelE/ParE family toxin [Galbibacter sp. BG1]|nr:type II toxin-antitoxin system RelE/ParE family toxin [Galbibacter sp. BG1]QLE03151.1 type II toxin-antitoxin system RelE/ParE family toxin [Galbibacter sp. BG1]
MKQFYYGEAYIGHGFQKKTQKTPKDQIDKAEQIKKEYYDSKE